MKFYYGSEISYVNAVPLQIKRASEYTLITNNLSVAILKSVKLKHIPLFILNINNYFFIIETTKNAFEQFRKKAYIYELDCNESDVKKDDWFYFPKYEYEIHKPVKIIKRIQLNNVYDVIKKDPHIKIIKYNAFMKFIKTNIPEKKYIATDEDNKYFYHGSHVDIKDKYLKPMDDGFEKVPHVYVNRYKSASLKFCVKGLAVTTIWGCKNEYVWFLEIYPRTFDAFKTSGYMYYVNKTGFVKDDYPSYTSTKKVNILRKEYIPNVYKEMRKQPNIVMINLSTLKKFLMDELKK